MAPYEQREVLLSVENVSLELGEGKDKRLILRDINIQIKDIVRPGMCQGQIVGFLGPSGVGKTKLFEVLSGLRQPTTGTVRIGREQKPTRVGSMGVVQQNYPLFNHRNVWDNLHIAAKLCKGCPGKKEGAEDCCDCRKVQKQKVEDILVRFGLQDKQHHFPIELSGGQRQRVAIAQQLMSADYYLLLDEPFSGLDINMVKEVSNTLKEIAVLDEENTIIIVSHDIAATAAISDTLWIMGRDHNPDGSVIPGAYIKHTINLMERGLAWQENSHGNPSFGQLVHEVRSLFPSL